MSPETITWIWLGGGIALMLSELVVPGAVVVFLGAAAVLVAGARWIGLIDELMTSFTVWFVLSLAMVIGLRGLVGRFTSPEKTVQATDEDLDAFGREVEVVARVTAVDESGRVRFQGTSWPARCLKDSLEVGARGRIIHRDNLAYVVELVAEPAAMEKQPETPIKGGA